MARVSNSPFLNFIVTVILYILAIAAILVIYEGTLKYYNGRLTPFRRSYARNSDLDFLLYSFSRFSRAVDELEDSLRAVGLGWWTGRQVRRNRFWRLPVVYFDLEETFRSFF